MNGLKALFWGLTCDLYNLIVHPDRRWKLECDFCDRAHRARSHNGTLLRNSLHVAFADDHPDGPEDTDIDWESGGNEPDLVNGETA
jgi:hypothetical protein